MRVFLITPASAGDSQYYEDRHYSSTSGLLTFYLELTVSVVRSVPSSTRLTHFS